jgi:GT2 family glycosyltransferase
LYPVGCCALVPHGLFLELGGFDAIYAPFFWEDVDLGYRGWRRGLRVLHVPEAVCHHEGSATLTERHDLAERERCYFRSRVLFHLRNIQEPGRRAGMLGAFTAYALFESRPERRRALVEALDTFSKVGRREPHGLSDSEILERVACASATPGQKWP